MSVLNKLFFKLLSEEKKKDVIIKSVEKLHDSNSNMRFFKDADTDQLRWLAAWSSNYLDDDYPRDIISESAHKDFIGRVDSGEASYPELWHWHTKGTRWGITDFLAYDEDHGICWASGLVDTGKEHEALALLKSNIKIGVSHGMKDVVWNYDGLSVIEKYTTYEISDLPLRWAANRMTAMFMPEDKENKNLEDNMSLTQEKKEYLKKVGLTEEQIDGLDEFGEEMSEAFGDRARKEASEEPQENADLESEKAEGENGEATGETEDAVEEKETEETPVDLDAVMKAVREGFDAFGEIVADTIAKMDDRVKALETKEVERKKEQQLEPLSATLLEKFRAIGAEDTAVGEDDELAKDAPEEKEFDDAQFKSASEFLAHAVSKTFGFKSE